MVLCQILDWNQFCLQNPLIARFLQNSYCWQNRSLPMGYHTVLYFQEILVF